jgi:hypothetical protein
MGTEGKSEIPCTPSVSFYLNICGSKKLLNREHKKLKVQEYSRPPMQKQNKRKMLGLGIPNKQ